MLQKLAFGRELLSNFLLSKNIEIFIVLMMCYYNCAILRCDLTLRHVYTNRHIGFSLMEMVLVVVQYIKKVVRIVIMNSKSYAITALFIVSLALSGCSADKALDATKSMLNILCFDCID